MPLVTSEELLRGAQRGGYAVGAFNVENMEMAQAVVWAAERQGAPVIVQTTPSTLRYGSVELYRANVAQLAAQARVPVVLHLDHGDSFETAVRAIRAGYTSVMIDGSRLPLAENMALTGRVVAVAAPCGLPVEGELGTVGGKEDDLEGGQGGYTDPGQALEFVRGTGVSSLAVGIGTAHGIYKGVPRLDKGRLADIRALVDVPLVLHGASGLPDAEVAACIGAGICKVNYATELRLAYTGGVREVLRGQQGAFDPKVYGRAGRQRVQEFVMGRMAVCGCCGKY